MSEPLTREQVEQLAACFPADLLHRHTRALLEHDAALRKECADAQQRYETQCAGTKSRMEENQQLRQRVTELEHENKNLLTCQCEQCDNSLEEEAVCGNCYRKSQSLLENEKENVKASCQVLNEKDQQVADLTAKLAEVERERASWVCVAHQSEFDRLEQQLATVTQERDELRRAQRSLANSYNVLSAQLAALSPRRTR